MTDNTREKIHLEFCNLHYVCRYRPDTTQGETSPHCTRLDDLLDTLAEQMLSTSGSEHVPFAVTLPTDMPYPHAATLQATLDSAWTAYEGDPGDTEAFWNFLTGRTG